MTEMKVDVFKDADGIPNIIDITKAGRTLKIVVNSDRGFTIEGQKGLLPEFMETLRMIMPQIGAMRLVRALTKQGGAVDISSYSTDVEVTTTSSTFVLMREFNIATPTVPSGLTVYKYALQISVELDNSAGWNTQCAIYVDDVLKKTHVRASTNNYGWKDYALEVDEGSHNVKLYLKWSGGASTAKLRGTRAYCGIGCVRTSETKVAQLPLSGEAKGSFIVAGYAWESAATVSGIIKADSNNADKLLLDVSVSNDGAEYSDNDSFSSMPLTHMDVHGYATSLLVGVFFKWLSGVSIS